MVVFPKAKNVVIDEVIQRIKPRSKNHTILSIHFIEGETFSVYTKSVNELLQKLLNRIYCTY